MGEASGRTTGGEVLVGGLLDRGVDTIFGLPGVQLDGLFDAFAGAVAEERLRVIHTRHEQATSFMADGYARATGRVGVCAVVPGPGVLNAGAGLATAAANHSPVLLVAGHLFGGDRAVGSGALHEIPDQSAVINGTIGASERIRSPDDIGPVLDAAFSRLLGCPARPAAVEIGPDVLTGTATVTLPGPAADPAAPVPDNDGLDQAAHLRARSRRPVIVAGGGARVAGEGLMDLADALAAPVVLTAEGKGAVPADREGTVPLVAGFTLVDRADAVVVVGSRHHTLPGVARLGDEVAVVRIDADGDRLARYRPEVGALVDLVAEAGLATAALAKAVADLRPPDADRDDGYRAEVAELRAAVSAGLAREFPETWAHCAALRDALPADGILVDEMTQVGYLARTAFPVTNPRTYLGSGYQGTLGFGFPTALGASVGRPDVPVVSINGDGGFLYGATELATAVLHRIPVVAVVFTDGAFGNVKRIQRQTYDREIASTLGNPDFAALAGAFGVGSDRVEGPDQLRTALDRAISRDEPWLIEVPLGAQPDPWPILTGRRRL